MWDEDVNDTDNLLHNSLLLISRLCMCDNDVGDTSQSIAHFLIGNFLLCMCDNDVGDTENLLHSSLLVISCFVCVIMMLVTQTIYYTLPCC